MTSNDLQEIPGVGPSIATDLVELGVERVHELAGRDPGELYATLCRQRGSHIDRCVLYVFREAVYFAETEDPDPDLLLWWNWKDRRHPNERVD